jgi:cytochrome c553
MPAAFRDAASAHLAFVDLVHGLTELIHVKSVSFSPGRTADFSRKRDDAAARVLSVSRNLSPATMKKLFALLALAGVANFSAAADIIGNAKAAENKVAMCIGCHGIPGYKATFPEVYQVPMIGGQSAKYIESALHAYKKGDRKHPSMRGIAASLSDQDIADVAAYYSQQK